MWIQSLGQEDPLGSSGGHGNTLQYSYLENPVDRRATVHGVVELDTTETT